jgi:hypothetical protein
MDISKICSGAWMTLQPVDEKVGELRLRLAPLPTDFTFDGGAELPKIVETLSSYVHEWNLEDGGQPVECSAEKKTQYLPYLLRLRVKGDDNGAPETLATEAIFRFCADLNNFLKN